MRVPKGAPSAGLLYWQQKFPSLKRIQKPSLGTIAVVSCVGVTLTAIGVMMVLPHFYKDYYKQVQQEKRSVINASREELAMGMRPWSDPFQPPK